MRKNLICLFALGLVLWLGVSLSFGAGETVFTHNGLCLGMTKAEVESIIGKDTYLTPFPAFIPGINPSTYDGAKITALWTFEKSGQGVWGPNLWVYFCYDAGGRLGEVQIVPDYVPENLIETKLRQQFADLYDFYCQMYGSPTYWKPGFSVQGITASSFETTLTQVCYWVRGDLDVMLYLWKDGSKYYPMVTITNSSYRPVQ
jgi:hypothetical protein